MRVAVLVAGGVPNPTASGGAVTVWTILTELLRRGHEPMVVVLTDPEVWDPTGVDAAERTRALRELGADVVTVASASAPFFRTRPRRPADRVRRAWRSSDEELLPHLVDADRVRAAIEGTGAEVALAYHFEMVAASRAVPLPRFAAVGDPPQLSALYRFRELFPRPAAFRRALRLQSQLRHLPPLLVRLLNECTACGAFAAHHAEWLRGRGATGCRYLRTPVPDPGPPWADGGSAAKPTILLVGHLMGVVTLEGLRLFVSDVLPALERELGEDGFEVRIAGGYEVPKDLAGPLSRPSVRLLGHVEQAEEEFRRAHVLLVPNSIPLGIRVRIVTGFSFGSCVVTHAANALGIPELEHGRNALVGSSGDELASHVLRALRDEGLRRRLGRGARETYERAFVPEVAAGAIVDTLERIADAVPAAA